MFFHCISRTNKSLARKLQKLCSAFASFVVPTKNTKWILTLQWHAMMTSGQKYMNTHTRPVTIIICIFIYIWSMEASKPWHEVNICLNLISTICLNVFIVWCRFACVYKRTKAESVYLNIIKVSRAENNCHGKSCVRLVRLVHCINQADEARQAMRDTRIHRREKYQV